MLAWVEVNGVTLAYAQVGSGPPAVLLHGFPLDHRLWLLQLAELGELRRCMAVDLRGFGASGPAAQASLPMELHADDVAALLTRLDAAPADVVGLSMGGYVALALWERHPQVVRSLALLDTRAAADTDQGRAARHELARQTTLSGRSFLVDRMMGTLLSPGAGVEARARLRTMMEATPYETIVAGLAGMAARPDRSHLLASITVPTLVLVGEEDAVNPPAEARAMADAIPGAELVVVPGVGHLPPLEAPAATNTALARFLRHSALT